MGTTPTYPIPITGIMLAGITPVNEPATFDPTQGVKRWVDPSKAALPPGDVASYVVFDPVSGTEVPLKITNSVAATSNVPKIYPPAPAPAPTQATLSVGQNTVLVPAEQLSTQEEANEIATEVGQALGVQDSVAVSVLSGWTWTANGETRQPFLLSIPSLGVSAWIGQLLAAKNAYGVGAPGSWGLSASNQIVWNSVPLPQPNANTPPDIPFPVRALRPGESFQSAGLPGIWEVVSATSPAALAAPATAGQVGQLQSDLNLIKQFLGING